MRDGAVLRLHEASAKRDALILGQFEFLRTRQEAFERVFRSGSWYDRVFWLFVPLAFLRVVGAVQADLLEQGRRDLEAARARGKIVTPSGGVA